MEHQDRHVFDRSNLHRIWFIVSKRKRFLIVVFLTAVACTAGISLQMPKIYRGDALLNILQYEAVPPGDRGAKEIIEARELIDMIGRIDDEKRVKILPTLHRTVKNIKLRAIKDSKDKIAVSIDATKADSIQETLLHLVAYINDFDIVKLIVKEEKERLLKRSNELSAIIRSSADLSATYRRLLNEGRLLPLGFNPIDLDKRIADIKLEKLGTDQRLQRLDRGGVLIAKQPYINSNPVNPKILLNVMMAAVASIFFGIFIVFSVEYVRNIIKSEEKN